jgi:hypothetical protein
MTNIIHHVAIDHRPAGPLLDWILSITGCCSRAGQEWVSAPGTLAQYEMTRHGNLRLGQAIDVGFHGYAVMHNYKMDRIRTALHISVLP